MIKNHNTRKNVSWNVVVCVAIQRQRPRPQIQSENTFTHAANIVCDIKYLIMLENNYNKCVCVCMGYNISSAQKFYTTQYQLRPSDTKQGGKKVNISDSYKI